MTVARVLARTVAVAILVVLALPLGWKLLTGDFYLTVEGRSMTPTYALGDVLVVQEPTGRELDQLGSIVIVAWDPADPGTGARYVHRVVEPLGDGTAWLQGDGNPDRDPRPVAQDQVLGTPRLHLAGDVATVFAFTQSLPGRVLLGGAALVLLLVPLRRRSARAAEDGPGQDHPGPSRTAAEGVPC